jgi:hypothetical protein
MNRSDNRRYHWSIISFSECPAVHPFPSTIPFEDCLDVVDHKESAFSLTWPNLQALLFWAFRRARNGGAGAAAKPEEKKLNPWDQANLLQNMKNEEVHVTTVANQRYVYREYRLTIRIAQTWRI